MSSSTNEDILLSLLSLGFEQSDCETVLQYGVRNVQEAIDLLLDKEGTTGRNLQNLLSTPKEGGEGSSQGKDEVSERNQQLKNEYNEQLRKRRLEESATKERVLKSFQADRARQKDIQKKQKNCQGNNVHHDEGGASASTTKAENQLDTTDKVKDTVGRVRIRLPTGVNMDLHLAKHTMLKDVYNEAVISLDHSLPFTIMQPFPRKDFTSNEMEMSLEDLNLFPSANLVLHLPKQRQPEQLIDVDEEIAHQEDDHDDNDNDGDDDDDDDDFMDDEMANEGVLGGSGSGESRLLAGNITNEINDMEVEDFQTEGPSSDHLKRHIDSLLIMSAKCVAHSLTVLDTKIVNGMSILSPNTALEVINVLMSWKMLSPKLMSSFIPCKLKELHLDSYGLATNELLEKLRFHTSISVLSLKSCGILNDPSVASCLQRLRAIKFLNLSDCTRLTGKILDYIVSLEPLEVLILDKLKLTNDNVNHFLKSQQLPNLKKLSFDFCQITSYAFFDVKLCSSLVSLSLNNTQISTLGFLKHFPSLSKLHLQNTHVSDAELDHVEQLENLRSLKLRGTNISTSGLQQLQGLQLTFINTPDRQTVSNETIALLTAFPLQTLDLSDHIHLTKDCIPSIAQLTTLTSLSLSNTKINDENLMLMVDLQNLEELDVSKTLVSNAAVSLMKQLLSLHSINLAWTKVDDDCIVELNMCTLLVKLNLSHNTLTDNGIIKLQLNNLTTLVLDSTQVSWKGALVCIKLCPNLKMLRNSATNVLISSL